MPTDANVYVQLLGPPTVRLGHTQVRLPRKAVGLLARLSVSPKVAVERDTLCRLLWPRSNGRQARHSLSQALYVVKRSLGGDALKTDGDSVAVGEMEFDTDQFWAAISDQDWRQAANAYNGDFAEGLWLASAPQFEHWADAIRRDYQTHAIRVLEELSSQADWAAAERLGRPLLDAVAGDPKVTALLVNALAAQGKIQEASNFASKLDEPLSTSLLGAIAELASASNMTESGPLGITFVGRGSAIRQLEQRFRTVLDTSCGITLVTGEAGVGKTALVNRFSKLLALRGAKVLTASAFVAEQNLPFGVVGQWLQALTDRDLAHLSGRPWLDVLRNTFPVIGGTGASHDPGDLGEIGHHRLLESLRRLIVEMAANRPVALVIDDIHWADSASITFAHYLLRRANHEPIFILATVRSDREHGTANIAGWEWMSRLVLHGLTESETEELISHAKQNLRNLDRADLTDLHRRTGGNPLLLTTLLSEAEEPHGPATQPPQSIVDFFKPRILERSHAAQLLLSAICLAGDQEELSFLSDIAGLSLGEARSARDELLDSQLVIESNGDISAKHGLVGEVALSLLSASEKQRLHGRAARRLTEHGTPPSAMVAVSHDLAGNRKAAFGASMTASEACDVLHARAEKEFFLKLALSNAPTGNDEATVRLKLAELYLQQRRRGDALDILASAALANAAPELARQAEITRLRIQAETTGDMNVLKSLWSHVRVLGGQIPPLIVADTCTGLARVAYDLGLVEVAGEIADYVEGILSRLPLAEPTARRLLRPITIIAFRRGYETALQKFCELPSPDGENPVYRASFAATKATVLVAAGRLAEAEELFANSLGIIERYALFDQFHMINNNLAVCLMEQGRYDEAESHFEIALDYATDTNPSQHSTAPDNLTILAYERGNYELALEMGTTLLGERDVSGPRAAMSLRAIVGLSGLELGDLPRCRESERELQILLEKHERYSNDMSYVHIFLARMTALRGEHETAIQLLDEAARHYRRLNYLVSARLQLEKFRFQIRNAVDCVKSLEALQVELAGTGAVPLIDRANQLLARG